MCQLKAIFFDLDGTLVDKANERIPVSTQEALRALRERGVKLFICSGRPPFWAALINQHFDFAFDGKVLLNGQYCVDKEGEAFYKNPLTREQLTNLMGWIEAHPQVQCTFMEEDCAYSNIEGSREKLPVVDVTRCLDHSVFQVSPRVGPEADEGILAQVKGVKSARWNDSSTDLIPAEGGKPVGMEKMLEHFGIAREECMAFGDGANDIEMLRYAGVGVAMGNGADAVKAAADYVTDNVDRDGIAKALKHFGLL